jgi:hypothetical protein
MLIGYNVYRHKYWIKTLREELHTQFTLHPHHNAFVRTNMRILSTLCHVTQRWIKASHVTKVL